METTITINENVHTIKICGRLDTTSSMAFEEKIATVYKLSYPNIVIDCLNLTYISSSGLRVFLTLYKSIHSKNGTLIFRNVNDAVMQIFDMTGFTTIFDIE